MLVIAVLCIDGIAQDVKTVTDPMNGSRSVQIVINAREAYKRADGSEFTPTLEIRCEATKSGKHVVGASLGTGGVPTYVFTSTSGPQSLGRTYTDTTEVGPTWVRIKFDDAKPSTAGCRMDPDKDHLRIMNPGFTQNGDRFVKAALKAQTVYIGFPPRGKPWDPSVGSRPSDEVVSQFDLGGLKAEFDKHPECSVK